MLKIKDAKYYREMLNKDQTTLLILSIIFSIVSLLLGAFSIFFKLILLIIFLIILICNRKVNQKFVGRLLIIIGSFMVLNILIDKSLFGIIYFILGLFHLIHAIKYLIYFKKDLAFVKNRNH